MIQEWQDATKRGNIEKVLLLLENGVDINARDKYGQTALMNAAHAGHIVLVRLLIARGAELNITAKYNLSALIDSIGNKELVITSMASFCGRHEDCVSYKRSP